MDQELKTKWVAALRSGKYTQCRGDMRKGKSFCCLGVLAHVADPKGWFNHSSWNLGGLMASFSDGIRALIPSRGVEQILIQMNDVDEKSFTEIADHIEETL